MLRSVKLHIYLLLLPAVAIVFFTGCSSKRFTEELSRGADLKIKDPESVPVVRTENIINTPDLITRLYEKSESSLSPRWNNKDKLVQIISVIQNAADDGLNPDDYHRKEIESLVGRIVTSDKVPADDIGRLEFLLTDAFSLLSSHIAEGKTDPRALYPQWKLTRRNLRKDWSSFVDSTLLYGNINEALQNLIPKHNEYVNLKIALAKYRNIKENGGWGSFKTNMHKLEPGIRHPDIALLRKRLEVTQGLIRFNPGDTDLYDNNLVEQVKLFQKLNGLDPDGVVGKTTIGALNIPVEERIKTIEANLERWRWINDDLGKEYILVNIAGFNLKVVKGDSTVIQSQAIVGRDFTQTPVFSSMMKYIVLNPDWSVPHQIIVDEIVPEVIKDSTYLAKNDMQIVDFDGNPIDPVSIDWRSIPEKGFPYMIRQAPGPKNPLGRIKFVLPNDFEVYIHDTPGRSLFSASTRAFSHGCIRINRAQDLAEYFLKADPAWTPENVQKAIDSGKEQIIILKEPIPVHILYLTAWADNDGTVYFTRDVYSRDGILISALGKAYSQKVQ